MLNGKLMWHIIGIFALIGSFLGLATEDYVLWFFGSIFSIIALLIISIKYFPKSKVRKSNEQKRKRIVFNF